MGRVHNWKVENLQFSNFLNSVIINETWTVNRADWKGFPVLNTKSVDIVGKLLGGEGCWLHIL